MSLSNSTENNLLLLMYNGTAWANYADNASVSPETAIAWGFHTADPGEAGSMSTSQAAYTSYARVNVNRNSGGHVVTANSVSPAAQVNFASATGGSETETHFSTGKTGGGAAAILLSGTVTPNISVVSGVQPFLTTATTITMD